MSNKNRSLFMYKKPKLFIEDVSYKETSLSDHKMVVMRMNFKDEIKGPGVWILNTELLKNESYKQGIDKIIEEERENGMYWEDKRLWWENVKYEIKKYSIKYSRLIQKVKRSKEKEIRDKLKEELNKEEVNVQNVIIMEEELKKFEESKCNGAMLRSRAKYTVEGEKLLLLLK